jgi:predicted RNA binding protein YcfA (HicA-like mRNA interferase family)
MTKRLAIERNARREGGPQALPALPRISAQATLPLTEEPKPKLIILGAPYLASLANSGYSVEESLRRLKARNGDELIVTKQVMDELEIACREGRANDDGSRFITHKQLAEIKRMIWSGIVSLEQVKISEDERAMAHCASAASPANGDKRPTESEISIAVIAHGMAEVFDILFATGAVPTYTESKEKEDACPEPSVEDLRGFSDAQVIQVFGLLGYQSKVGNGHWKMQHPVTGMTATIPRHKDISPRTLNDILSQNGISRRVFLMAAKDAGLIDKKRSREIFGETDAKKPGSKGDSCGPQPVQSA